ncbi:NAD(P)-binding domain-containing protein [Methylocapsa polymorpha]|uniref:NAD(P)-binding domain-containing protein n=1 Tax=Methylocapsa polymorpha TaxID=3080828 RepID=A0ABZ0HMP9_9HYPH|nr:NAD(P)-binding domain-containing protein [Methylocapsa sp. RX1]
MKIGIIGAGHIGQAIARLAVANGHEVEISNSRGPETLTDIARKIGCSTGTAEEASRFGPVAVVTVPFVNLFKIDPAPLAGRIVIDTNNYYPDRDGRIAALDLRQTTTSAMVAKHFTASKVVKAFNAILAADLETPAPVPIVGQRRALPIAGDDVEAKQVVATLQDEFGFDTVDAGSLADSWRFERAKPTYCIPLDRAGLIAALAKAERDVELPHGSWRR